MAVPARFFLNRANEKPETTNKNAQYSIHCKQASSQNLSSNLIHDMYNQKITADSNTFFTQGQNFRSYDPLNTRLFVMQGAKEKKSKSHLLKKLDFA